MTDIEATVNERKRNRAQKYLDRRRAEAIRCTMRWRVQNPEKLIAYNTVAYAISTNRLTRGRCTGCGTDRFVCGYHTNYAKPLDVVWRCRPCNNRSKRLEKRREALSDMNDGHRPISG
jgi:hypothetical protein